MNTGLHRFKGKKGKVQSSSIGNKILVNLEGVIYVTGKKKIGFILSKKYYKNVIGIYFIFLETLINISLFSLKTSQT